MPANVFVDTNLWLYLFLKSDIPADCEKRLRVKRLFQEYPNLVVSNQVLNEVANVLFKKYHIDQLQIEQYLHELLSIATLVRLDEQHTFEALHLTQKYSLSFYDALILSSAQRAHCDIVFSEDMPDGQKIEKQLTIRNPFKTVEIPTAPSE